MLALRFQNNAAGVFSRKNYRSCLVDMTNKTDENIEKMQLFILFLKFITLYNTLFNFSSSQDSRHVRALGPNKIDKISII
jgi:hypothetical protein